MIYFYIKLAFKKKNNLFYPLLMVAFLYCIFLYKPIHKQLFIIEQDVETDIETVVETGVTDIETGVTDVETDVKKEIKFLEYEL